MIVPFIIVTRKETLKNVVSFTPKLMAMFVFFAQPTGQYDCQILIFSSKILHLQHSKTLEQNRCRF